MAAAPLRIRLRCKSWRQLKSIYERDLRRKAVFLKTTRPPAVGVPIRIDLSLPSESVVVLLGEVAQRVGPGEMGGRGPGVDIRLTHVPESTMWLVETALRSHARAAAPLAGALGRQRPPSEGDADAAPSIDDDHAVVDAETGLIEALQGELEAMRRLNPFQVLSVDYEASDDQVREAFGELTRKYHPDRFTRYQSREARQLASELFIVIRDAYRRLGTPAGRQRTLAALKTGQRSPTRGTRPTTPPRSAPRPTTPPQLAPRPPQPTQPPARATRDSTGPDRTSGRYLTTNLTHRSQRDSVAPAEQPATTGPPRPARQPEPAADSPGVPRAAGQSAARAAPLRHHPEAEAALAAGDYDQALDRYRSAVHADATDRGARAGLELVEGLKALARRDRLESAQRFEAVLELDPHNERAARELAELRRVATNERKGLLARLLGRKE
jgi:curved DNA-binding protein CbpA